VVQELEEIERDEENDVEVVENKRDEDSDYEDMIQRSKESRMN